MSSHRYSRKRNPAHRWLAAASLTLPLAVIPVVGSATIASAASCGSTGPYFAGTPNTPQTNYYAQANITLKSTTLCGASDSYSAAWTMITSNNLTGWTQSGYIWRQGISGSYLFAQANKNASSTPSTVYYNSAPSNAVYYELYDFSSGNMDLVANGINLITSSFDPGLAWSAPWVPEWVGEVHYQGDDVPGTSSSPTYFSNLGIKTSRGGSVVNPSGITLSTSNTNFGVAWDTSQSKFHIWSKS